MLHAGSVPVLGSRVRHTRCSRKSPYSPNFDKSDIIVLTTKHQHGGREEGSRYLDNQTFFGEVLYNFFE